MIAFVIDENLRLVFQPAEGGGMNDPVAVTLKRCSCRAFGLRKKPAPGIRGIYRVDRTGLCTKTDIRFHLNPASHSGDFPRSFGNATKVTH